MATVNYGAGSIATGRGGGTGGGGDDPNRRRVTPRKGHYGTREAVRAIWDQLSNFISIPFHSETF